MFKKKPEIIVGIEIKNIESLGLSVAALSKSKNNFFLIIYNGTDLGIKNSDIHNLGIKKDFIIINGSDGKLNPRLQMIKAAETKKLNDTWFIFCDELDIISNLDIPSVNKGTWAILQNSVSIMPDIITILKLIKNPKFEVEDKNIVTTIRPDFEINGTLFRTKSLIKSLPDMESNSHRLNDSTLWDILKRDNNDSAPIYMDNTNYIKIQKIYKKAI